MNQAVAEADDLGPRYLRVALAHFLGNAIGRLSNDFEQADEGEIELPVRIEVGSTSSPRHLDRLAGVIEHVAEEDLRVTARRTAPPPR